MYVIVIQIKSQKCINFIDIVDLKVITMTYFWEIFTSAFNENKKLCLKIANIQFSFIRCSPKNNTQKTCHPAPDFLNNKMLYRF